MLLQKSTHVKLQKSLYKILYLYEAYNETFVFLGMMGVKRDCLVHVNKQGKELFCHFFQRPMDSLGMMSEYEAIVLQTRANCITILDLKSYNFKRIPHWFMNEQSDQCSLYTFADTKYITLVQYGRYNDNRLKITYYNYPQKNPIIVEDRPLMYHRKELLEREFESTEDEWTFQHQIVKANNHSMIVWYKARHDETFQFKLYRQDRSYRPLYCYDKENMNGWEFKSIKIDHKLGDLYNFPRLNLAVQEVFEIQKEKLMIHCLSNRQKSHIEEQPIRNTYILDLLASTITQSPHNLGKLHEFQIDRYLLGSCHMIRTFNFRSGQSQTSPVYYFSNNTFELVSQETWVCNYKTKYTFPGYDPFVMLESQYENANVKEFKCSYKKLVELKEIILFFLLEIYEDFDEDLLQNVIELTC